jgi:hypothetical protein
LTKDPKHTMEKRQFLNKSCWENEIYTCRNLKLNSCLSPYTNINSKWIKYLNIRSEILKLLKERVGNTQEQIGLGNNFLNRTPMAQQLRIDKWDYMKLKIFCTSKEMVNRLKRQITEWEKPLPAVHLTIV